MKLLNEFKSFAMKWNVVDLAVAVIIGGAFGKIVSSLVNDIIMPAIGLLLWNIDFTKLVYAVWWVHIKYWVFIQNVVDFLIIALVIFIVIVKMLWSLKKKEEPKAEEVKKPTQEELLTEIRDLLKKK